MVFGYCAGYVIVATILLPWHYKLNLTSIYGYLGQVGLDAHRTGAAFFLLSRVVGASFRLFLVALVIDVVVLEPWAGGPPLWMFGCVTAAILAVVTCTPKMQAWEPSYGRTPCKPPPCSLPWPSPSLGLGRGGCLWAGLPSLLSSSDLTPFEVVDDWKANNH